MEIRISLGQKYRVLVNRFKDLNLELSVSEENRYKECQALLLAFWEIHHLVDTSGIFSKNEYLEDISTNYIPLLSCDYYIALIQIIAQSLGVLKGRHQNDRTTTLKDSQEKLIDLLKRFHLLGSILNESQAQKIEDINNGDIKSVMLSTQDPASRRARKIGDYKAQKELQQKLGLLNVNKISEDDTTKNQLAELDEEIVRQVYTDELKLIALNSFRELEHIIAEILILKEKDITTSKDPLISKDSRIDHHESKKPSSNERGFSSVMDRQGKILRPFTIKSLRQDLQDKIYGTGQTLPSFTVEQYLDYELANGKRLQEANTDKILEDSSDDSDEELRQREWDDWKDDNPKGSGNMKANIG